MDETTKVVGHTPGPWTLKEDKHYAHIVGVDAWDDPVTVVDLTGAMSGEDTSADARLIAAAPDLLAALEELVSVPNKKRPERVWAEAHAAIARAKGGDEEVFYCAGCGREESQCSADPCDDVREDREAEA